MRNGTWIRFLAVLSLIVAIFIGTRAYASVTFKPAPFEDSTVGRNSFTYSPALNHPTSAEKQAFIAEVKDYAIQASNRWGIPASAIIGMAAAESGFGFTRIAYYANNLFGLKIWDYNPADAWQLKGQPDEDGGRVAILQDYGYDRKVFDESYRRDNWYRAFNSRAEAVNYLAGTVLQTRRYQPARDQYQYRIKNGWTLSHASKQYCYDIAQAGFNHLGGSYYRTKIGDFMDEFDLYQYDVQEVTTPTPTTSPEPAPSPTPTVDQSPWISTVHVSPMAVDGKTVSGTVTISVAAGDDKGVAKVEFYSSNGGYRLGTDITSPYSVSWSTSPWVPNGEQILKVVAYDTAGNTVSATKVVNVQNSSSPAISGITVSPLSEGKYVRDIVTISATVSNTSEVSKVEFYSSNGAYRIGTDTTAPYTIQWATAPWVKDGENILKVIVYSRDGKSTSMLKTVYVDNNRPPLVNRIDFSPNTNGYYVWRDVTITASVSDPDGSSDIAKVEFFSSDGKYLIGSDATAPYSVVWHTYPWVPNGPQVIRVKVYDKSGNVAILTKNVYVANK